jgi:sulfate permease, SulP family
VKFVPAWARSYRRDWLPRDVIAGVIVGSVVIPQAVAYAQIAGLPPSAGLVAAPGALIAYALIGTSRTLVVSATTATSALSAAAVGPLVNGNADRFAALSAMLAIVAGAVLVISGFLRLGGVTDLVSKPVMTGFLFGLGLFVALSQLPRIFGVPAGSGNFFPRLWDLLTDLDQTQGWTLAVGLTSIALLVVLARAAPKLPGTLVVLVLAIVFSAALDLKSRGVDVVGDLPRAVPHFAWPGAGWRDVLDLLAPAFGIMIVSAEAVGVARTLAGHEGYRVSANRDLIAMGGSNLAAGLRRASSSRAGRARQWRASARAGSHSSRRSSQPGSSSSPARF